MQINLNSFWAKVRKTDGCWFWTGAHTVAGYGYVYSAGGTHASRTRAYTHRVSYELSKGKIPAGMVVRHMCHNPKCVNPAHLDIGQQKDNVQDMVTAGRHVGFRKLTKADEQEVLFLCTQGFLQREIAAEFDVTQQTISHAARRAKLSAPAEDSSAK